jgi:hypothetical protein
MYSNLFRIIGQGIDDELDVRSGGIACLVDDMKTMDCSRFFLRFFFIQRGLTNREKDEQGLRCREYELLAYVDCRERSVIQTGNDCVEAI